MKSIMYERFLSPWEQTIRTTVLGGFAVVMILFYFLGTVIEDRLQYASGSNDSPETKAVVPSVLGVSDVAETTVDFLFRDYGDGSASLILDIKNHKAPIYGDLVMYFDGDLELISGDCISVDSCLVSIDERFVKVSLRGYQPELTTKDDLGFFELITLQYEQTTGGMLLLDNSEANFSYMFEQGQDVNLLQGRKYEFPVGTYFK
jgi:hypothetical protein